MRNFFSKGIKGLFEENKDNQSNASLTNNKSESNGGFLTKRGSKTNVLGSPGNKMDDKEAEQYLFKLIYNAAQCLAETIQEILSDTASLTGDNLSGFLRLIEVLDSSQADLIDNPNQIMESNGMGCLQILLNNINHNNFIELCNQAGLALALMHALRLIRMFEIKRGKLLAYSNESLRRKLDPSNIMAGKSITFLSSQRVCTVFAHLCSNGQTTEQIRQSIVKLLTFPLSVLPLAGVHIQQHSVNIISSMCRTGFTSQQVWYLHDAQAVTHMIRHLNDLTLLDQNDQSAENETIEGNNNVVPDTLLRGLSAESEDMWINGVQCIVDVLAASVTVSSVLMGDFESAGGPQLFVHILKNSSPQRFMRTINIITRMLFDPLKTNEGSTTFPAIGLIMNEIIIYTLHLKRCIKEDDNIEVLIEIGTALLNISDSLSQNDYIIQGIAYSLLTMYSNDPQNCSILENIHHFLPTLIITLPALKNLDVISAVLTTMNYVCQCVEAAAPVPLLALCAACTIMINQALLIDLSPDVRTAAIEQLELTFSSYEAIMRSSSKFTMILAKDSLLKFLFIDSFEKLCILVSLNKNLDDLTYLTFEKLISLLIGIHTKTYNITDALCKNGIILYVRNLIESKHISHNFAEKLLLIIEDMAKINNNYTGEGLECIFYMLESTIGDFEKQSKLIQSASKIIRDNECASLLFSGKGFIEKTIDLINLVAEKFKASTLISSKIQQNQIQEPIYVFLESIVRLLSIEFSLTTPQNNEDSNYELNRIKFQNYYSLIANGLIKSFIFSSSFAMQGIALIFELMNGFSGSLVIFNTGAVELLLLIIKKIDPDAATAALKRLCDYAQSSLPNVKKLGESEAANLLIQIFYDVSINGPKHLILPLVKIIKLLSCEYLTLQTFIHLLQFIVQPTILHFRKENLLLPPWIANDQEQTSNSWDILQFLVDITIPSFNGHDSVPFLRLGRSGSKDVDEPCYISTILTETGKTLPITGFCFSCWLRLDLASEKMKDRLKGIVPIFSLNSESTDSCYFEINFDIDKNCFIVVTTNGDSYSIYLFNAVTCFNPWGWNNFILNFRKNKKSTPISKATVSLYFNGLQCDPLLSETVELEFPVQNSLLDIIVGRTVLLEKAMQGKGNAVIVDKWNLGPIHLFDEVFSTDQICAIFAKGASYVGSFQGESPLSDYISTKVCNLLQQCDFGTKPVDQYLENLGLKGYEMVVEPRLEPISVLTLNSSIETSTVTHPVVSIDPSNVVPNSKSEIVNPLNNLKQVIKSYSSSSDGLMSLSTIFNVSFIGKSLSFADCISSLGGPAVLFPMLQEASSEQQICQTLLLIHSSVVHSKSNLKYMQTNGYKIMSFILSLKPKEIITESVIQYLFDMSVHNQSSISSNSQTSYLFVDTSAFYYLLLNQQVWDASKYSIAACVLQHIKDLTSDDKYAILNSKRLSAMGTCRWILLLCLYGIEQSSQNVTATVTNSSSKWTFTSWSSIEMSEYRDEAEPFFHVAISIIQTIMCIDLRKKDLEMILKIILYSFIPRFNEVGSSTSYSMNSSSDSNHTDYPFCNYNISHLPLDISFLGQFRIYLLRLLFSLFDDHSEEAKFLQTKKSSGDNGRKLSMAGVSTDSKDIMKLFRGIFSPNWFIGVFEKSVDIATKSHILRLLGLFFQKDVAFRRDFCANDGFQVLNTILSSEPQEIPVILPLLAIFFNIPMQILLHPFQMKTIQSFIQILELDECDGPTISEPDLSELTVPLLSILFDCYINAFRAKDQSIAPLNLVVDLLMGIFQYGMDKSHSFKLLMQHKYAMDIFATVLLDCSDAYNDFGSKIFSDNTSFDVASFIIDDYITLQGTLASNVSENFSNIRVIHFYENIEHNIDINFPSPEGLKMSWLLSLVFQQAILDHDNPLILYGFFTSFPKSYLNSYQYGYQKVIIEKFYSVVEIIIGTVTNLNDSHLNSVINIINCIVCVIPLVRANILNDYVQFEFLKICLDLTQKCFQNQFSNNEKSQRLIKEIVLTSRFFAVSCSNNISNANPKYNKYISRVVVLGVIKDNIGDLINSFVEDSIETVTSPINRFIGRRDGTGDDKTVINSMMTDSQISMTPGKKNNSPLAFAKAERNKISLAFCMFLLNSCYFLVFDDDSIIRYNAIRIMSYLATHRKTIIEHLLSNNAQTAPSRIWRSETMDEFAKDIDVFKDGLSKLIPNAAGKYELYLKGGTDDNDSEDNRFADFTFWVSDNNAKCDKVFANIESLLQGMLPSASEIEEIDRQIQSSKISRDKIIRGPSSGVVSSMERSEDGQKLGEQISVLLKRWSIYGMMYLSNGAVHWKNVWAIMQCTPVWGSEHILAESSINSKMWSLDACEGPERTRKKLERYLNPTTIEPKFVETTDESDSSNNSISNQTALDSSLSIDDTSNMSNDAVVTRKDSKSNESRKIDRIDDDTHDMESFLKRVSIRGIIKKITGYRSSGDIIEKDFESDSLLSLNQFSVDNKDDQDHDSLSPTESVVFTRERKFSNDNDINEINSFESDSVATNSEFYDESDLSVNTSTRHRILSVGTDLSDSGKLEPSGSMKSTLKLDIKVTGTNVVDSAISSKNQKSMILQEIVKGLIGQSEWMQGKVYNVKRIYGLEAQAAMLVVTKHNIHILSGFTLLKESKKNLDRQLDWSPTLNVTGDYHSKSIEKNSMLIKFTNSSDSNYTNWVSEIWRELLHSDLGYCKVPFDQVYSIFKRRHELKYTAMEITDIKGYSLLVSCQSVQDNEELLITLIESDLPSSIFNKVIGSKNLQLLRGISNVYNRLIALFVSTITTLWQSGEITNFEYLMHINAAAGRSFQDLTQYPVFPWIIADYTSETLDLNDPKSFRDLSKPMGALGSRRAKQCRDRYQTMDEFYSEGMEGSSPPFFYGTHYSCAGYVLHYLMRLQPFSNMALALQGGCFDKPDRLFISVESSWLSASRENLQDVRELIPEFFYLPEFLTNVNKLDLGVTQKDEVVNDVALPRWAHNDPHEFIRIHREALESKYVSENLHNWIDLIFGFKQRGKAAIDAMNVFIHLTYEGEVDVDLITDNVLKNATISQINNFGQTPSKIFNKPHPKKIVPEVAKKVNETILIDPSALQWHSHLSPPLCVIGAMHYNLLNKISFTQVVVTGVVKGLPVGDIRLVRDKIVSTPLGTILIPPVCKRTIKIGGPSGSLSIQPVNKTVEGDKDCSIHENLHVMNITCVSINKAGDIIATGSDDASVRVWNIITNASNQSKLKHYNTFIGHIKSVRCIDLNMEYSIIVSGGSDCKVVIWDFRTKKLIRILNNHTEPIESVSVNPITGNIVVLTNTQLTIYTINGYLISFANFLNNKNDMNNTTFGKVVLAVPTADWQDGVVAVTGHTGGHIHLWRLRSIAQSQPLSDNRHVKHNYSKSRQLFISLSPTKTHRADISVIKLCSTIIHSNSLLKQKEIVVKTFEDSRSLDLLVGDVDGNISRWAPYKLDQLQNSDLHSIVLDNS